jgi:hypothetical protein
MIRIMPLFAGMVAVACSACAPAPAPFVGPVSGIGTGNPNCSATQFANSVQVLQAAFNPTKLSAPSGGTQLDKNTAAWQDLSNAFDAAPHKFRQRLCMTSVLIDPYGLWSWGFRNPNEVTQRFIGLPSSLWGGGNLTNFAPAYSTYETDVFSRIFAAAIGQPWDASSASPPAYGPAVSSNTSVDSSVTTVLAILAHEYGHTLFYELFKAGDPSGSALTAKGFCRTSGPANNGYFDNTWASITVPANYWSDFGLVTDAHLPGFIQIQDIQNERHQIKPNWSKIASEVAALYADDSYFAPGFKPSGLWPSIYGSISPIEDFVETFKYVVLTHPQTNKGHPVTSMPLYITSSFGAGMAFDVFSDEGKGTKQEFKKKKLCIYSFIR